MIQSYRNISRVCKQYFYGDKELEQLFLFELRNFFKIPFTCETPVHLLKYGGVTLLLFRKGGWRISLTETTSCVLTTNIHFNSSPTNYTIDTFKNSIRRLKTTKRASTTPGSKLRKSYYK